MKRMSDEFSAQGVLAPVSVAAATSTASSFVDTRGKGEVAFLLSLASLAKGKSVTVSIYTSASETGTSAVKVAEHKFTAADAMSKIVVNVSYKPSALHERYVGIKFQHDGADAILCCATASVREAFRPAANSWVLEA